MHLPKNINRIKSVSVGSNHNLILDIKGNMYSWGANSKGQLGLNHYDDIDVPSRIIV